MIEKLTREGEDARMREQSSQVSEDAIVYLCVCVLVYLYLQLVYLYLYLQQQLQPSV